MKNFFLKILLVLVVLVVVGFLARNLIARKAVEIGVAKITGFPLEIGAVNVGLFSSELEVSDLKLMNPSEFEERRFVDLPKFHLQYTLGSVLHGAPHVKEMVVNINEVVIVKNVKGQTNTNVIQDKLAPAGGTEGDMAKPSAPEKKAHYQVDVLRVHIGTVIMKDYSKGQPSEHKITLNRDITFENISESTSVSALVMKVVFGQLGDLTGGLIKGIGNTGQTLQKTGKGLLDSIKKAVPGH